MATPLFNQLDWMFVSAMGQLPDVFVNVYNCRAQIMMRAENGEYADITDALENGEDLAEDAEEAFGGGINISGWYSPTIEILEAIDKAFSYKTAGRKG